ncbi:DUF3325 domain-containing protein [Pseudoxanthomonas sp. USHLN014]|uniref:DUF3325 domain-containing protein n=1 Tax=Pseudoxanthomonas sp. USHLN014 TaxID=3081297 RepID=UPI00301E2626
MSLLAIALAFSGFVGLCLGMEKHQLELHGAARAQDRVRRRWAWLGWALVAASFVCAVAARGWGIGPVLWLVAMTVSGIAITFGLLPYRPRWVKPGAVLLPLLALAGLLAG